MFQYNNMLAFAVSGIDNGDPNAPGFVRPPGGPHCIKIHGRTYHRLATAAGRRNAVRYVCATLLFSSLLWHMSPFFLRAFESGTLCTMHWPKCGSMEQQFGRASWRERGCQYGKISGV